MFIFGPRYFLNDLNYFENFENLIYFLKYSK